jgi:hypothetical protein
MQRRVPRSRAVWAVIAAIASMATARATAAQAAPSVPLYTVDAMVGYGPRTERLGELWFHRPNREGLLRLAMSVRVGSAGRVRANVLLDINGSETGDDIGLCRIAPNGSCSIGFPTTSGLGLGLGVRAAATSRIGVGVSAGIQVLTNTSVARVPFVGAEGTVRITRYVSVVATVRQLSWRQSGVGRLWFRPVGVGIRLHSSR